jgi:predicted signal transduction protein with EAL and GGDEF domain
MLTEVARRFQKQLSAADDMPKDPVEATTVTPTVGRLGGDEFLVLLPRMDVQAAVAVSERLLEALAVPLVLDGYTLHMRASLGVAVYWNMAAARPTAAQCRPVMYAAKRVEGSAVVVFQREVDHAGVRRSRLTADLREALAHEQFELHYQTIVNVPRVRVDAAEALLRWQHPALGTISPAEFVPLLERSGLIVPVGLWALRRACQQLLAWQDAGSTIASVAVACRSCSWRSPTSPATR